MVTVGDAISDLPEIENNEIKDQMPYGSKPLTHFQRKVSTVLVFEFYYAVRSLFMFLLQGKTE